MQDLINQILNWPIIAQGALGSALFWVVLKVGYKTSNYIHYAYSRISTHHKKQFILTKYVRTLALSEDEAKRTYALNALIFVTLRHVSRGIIFATLGFMLDSFIPIFSIIGYVVALYFFFLAADTTRKSDSDLDAEEEIERLEKEMDALDEEKT